MLIRDEVSERGEQEGAKPAAVWVDGGERLVLEQAGKKALGEVFSVGGRMPVASQEGVNGEPIVGAEFLKGFLRFRRTQVPRTQDNTPKGCNKRGASWGAPRMIVPGRDHGCKLLRICH